MLTEVPEMFGAEQLLTRYGLSPRLVDIVAEAGLRERYTHCVPVVVID